MNEIQQSHGEMRGGREWEMGGSWNCISEPEHGWSVNVLSCLSNTFHLIFPEALSLLTLESSSPCIRLPHSCPPSVH